MLSWLTNVAFAIDRASRASKQFLYSGAPTLSPAANADTSAILAFASSVVDCCNFFSAAGEVSKSVMQPSSILCCWESCFGFVSYAHELALCASNAAIGKTLVGVCCSSRRLSWQDSGTLTASKAGWPPLQAKDDLASYVCLCWYCPFWSLHPSRHRRSSPGYPLAHCRPK